MFNSGAILCSKAALGQIWIAGTYVNQKLKKSSYAEVDVASKCKDIVNPVVEFSLRITSHLMYGVTRVHDAQVQQFASECNAVLVRVRLAYRPAEEEVALPTLGEELIRIMPPMHDEIIPPALGEEVLNMLPPLQEEIILPTLGEEFMRVEPSQLEQLAPFPVPEMPVGLQQLPIAPMAPSELMLPDFEIPMPEPVPLQELPIVPPEEMLPEELVEAAPRKRRAKVKQPQIDAQTILSGDYMKACLQDASDTMCDRPIKTSRVTAVVTPAFRKPAIGLPPALRNAWAKLSWVPDRGVQGQFPVEAESLLPDVEQLRAELSASRHEIPIQIPSPVAAIPGMPPMSKPPSPIPMVPALETLREEYEPMMPEIPEVEMPRTPRIPVIPAREVQPEEAERINKFHKFIYDEHFDINGNRQKDSVSFFELTLDANKALAAKAFYYTLSLHNQGKLKLLQREPFADINVFDVLEPTM